VIEQPQRLIRVLSAGFSLCASIATPK